MASVDDRIVRMEFDNAAFERKIASTIASLQQLDKALKFTNAGKGIADVNSALKNVDVSHISQGIEGVSKSFIALSTIAITTLAQITASALSTGAQISKAFTVAPLIDGFREYETQLNSVQTILANTASKGTTLDQVNDALQRLNVYSDQTIYNFGQMAKNIGTFTAAGVDLETSVSSIKGIANLAAMSGSNAEQASNAMYQLSQAIATGSLKLIDWNSVVNAGMGGEAFKTALFETGKAMGTLMDVPVEQTFKEWEDSGHNFRESLSDAWITSEVLTQTLSGFTGDLTEEMLLAKGFTQEAASNIIKTAAIAKAAATEVKTFTQLVGTVKEAVGTGWADSFKIIIGNFTQAKELWTGVNNSIGSFVNKNAEARNALLQGWQDLGGRDLLIMSLENAFKNLGLALAPIKEAFRDIFPAMTAERLVAMTASFARFTEMLRPSAETIDKIKRIFSGLFSVLSIGWEILKEGTKFLAGLVKELLHLVDAPGITEFIAKIGDGLTDLQAALVKGGGIKAFFAGLGAIIEKPLQILVKIRDAIGDVFGLFSQSSADAVDQSMTTLGDRFESVKAIFKNVGEFFEPLEGAFQKIKDVFVKIKDAVGEFFGNLGRELADVMNKADFSEVLDALNTGLLLGITTLLVKFLKNGFNIGLGVDTTAGGFFDTITNSFGQLTKTLEAMQTNIRASALLKIAGAIGILTASVLILSTIDSEALTKALTAMAVGFGQLMASFAVLTKLAASPVGAAAFTVLSTGLILLSGAILVLTLAVKSMGKLSWEQLARGIGGITTLLGVLVVTTKPLAANSKGMVVAGVGITAIAAALVILGVAMKIFATMSWEDMAKGLVAVGLLLAGLAGALHIMPAGPIILAQAAAIGIISYALVILAGAVALFGNMEWETIARGFVGIAGGLLIIAGALHLMPAGPMILAQAAALVVIGFALNEIAVATKLMATMEWDEIARGLVTLAGSLAIIAGAMHLMQGALPGAAALLVISFALGVLATDLKIFGGVDWGDLLQSLGKLALAIGVIALISLAAVKATPFILALGIALGALALAFALFGAGVFLLGKGLESIAAAGEGAAESLLEILKTIAKAMPELAAALAEGLLEFIKVLTKGVPVIVKFFGKLINGLLVELAKIIPKVGPLIVQLLNEIFRVIKSYYSKLIDLGFFIIKTLLEGISNNIGPIVTTVGDIVVRFLEALEIQIPRITKAIADTVIAAVTTASFEIGRVAATLMFGCAVAFMDGFMKGLQDVLDGPVFQFFISLPGKVLEFIGDIGDTLLETGKSVIRGFWNGLTAIWDEVTGWLSGLGKAILNALPLHGLLRDIGEDVMNGFWNGLKSIWHTIEGWLGDVADKVKSIFEKALSILSPSKVMMRIGEYTMMGFHIGMKNEWDKTESWLNRLNPDQLLDNALGSNLSKALTRAVDQMNTSSEFNPTITPVLDLTEIAKGASAIGGMIQTSPVVPVYSYGQAQTIAAQKTAIESPTTSQNGSDSAVKFEQNIYAPTELSTSAIYKNTRNQIRMAKEELSIP